MWTYGWESLMLLLHKQVPNRHEYKKTMRWHAIMVQDETDVQHKTQCNSSWWQVSNHKFYWFHFKHYSNVTDDGRSCNLQKYLTYKKRTLLVIVKFMTNHDNFFSQYFLSVLDPLLGSPARYQKISRPPFTRGSRGYAAAQPMFCRCCWYDH